MFDEHREVRDHLELRAEKQPKENRRALSKLSEAE